MLFITEYVLSSYYAWMHATRLQKYSNFSNHMYHGRLVLSFEEEKPFEKTSLDDSDCDDCDECISAPIKNYFPRLSPSLSVRRGSFSLHVLPGMRNVVDSHIQRIALTIEELWRHRVTRRMECQSRSWSQRGTEVNWIHHGDNLLFKLTGIQIATKFLPGPNTQGYPKLLSTSRRLMMYLGTNYGVYSLECYRCFRI